MQCPHCQVAFHDSEDDWAEAIVEHEIIATDYSIKATTCAGCKELIVVLEYWHKGFIAKIRQETIFPKLQKRVVLQEGIPSGLRDDHYEASNVLPISPKASAALSRRVLQTILRDQCYQGRDLSIQIDAVLSESDPDKILPRQVRAVIDAVRNFGNFSAHPITDLTTLQVINVEPNEAEWCIEIVEALFDHYYVRPTENENRLANLNAKLGQAGKPPTKS